MLNLSFQEVAARWKADKRLYVKMSTYSVYSQLCNNLIIPYFNGRGEFSEELVQNFVNGLLEHGYAIKTVKDTMLVLKMILRYGEKLQCWPHVEFEIHYPTQALEAKKLSLLSPREQQKLLTYLRSNMDTKNFGIMLCLFSGLRIGEVCGLQWKDLSDGLIHVNKTVQRIYIDDGAIHEYFVSIDTPKTRTSVREIPMTAELRSITRTLKKDARTSDYIISNAAEPLEPRLYRDYFKRTLRHLGLPAVRFHALRHSFATRCIESKCDYKTVSALLGHASISTTMDLYVHPGYAEKKRCIEQMAKVFR